MSLFKIFFDRAGDVASDVLGLAFPLVDHVLKVDGLLSLAAIMLRRSLSRLCHIFLL